MFGSNSWKRILSMPAYNNKACRGRPRLSRLCDMLSTNRRTALSFYSAHLGGSRLSSWRTKETKPLFQQCWQWWRQGLCWNISRCVYSGTYDKRPEGGVYQRSTAVAYVCKAKEALISRFCFFLLDCTSSLSCLGVLLQYFCLKSSDIYKTYFPFCLAQCPVHNPQCTRPLISLQRPSSGIPLSHFSQDGERWTCYKLT